MKILKIITIIANVLALFVLLVLLDGGDLSGGGFLFFLIIFVLNTIFVIRFRKMNTNKGWIGLFLERKAMEEKRKIRDLEGGSEKQDDTVKEKREDEKREQDSEQVEQVDSSQSTAGDVKYCGQCGAKSDIDDMYCEQCGTKHEI
ncbi:MAG: hypothetical protein WDZ82_00550 [Candidatus Paceibacterota bacterium]